MSSDLAFQKILSYLLFNVLYQGYLINFNQISCMQFSRYNYLGFYLKPNGLKWTFALLLMLIYELFGVLVHLNQWA